MASTIERLYAYLQKRDEQHRVMAQLEEQRKLFADIKKWAEMRIEATEAPNLTTVFDVAETSVDVSQPVPKNRPIGIIWPKDD